MNVSNIITYLSGGLNEFSKLCAVNNIHFHMPISPYFKDITGYKNKPRNPWIPTGSTVIYDDIWQRCVASCAPSLKLLPGESPKSQSSQSSGQSSFRFWLHPHRAFILSGNRRHAQWKLGGWMWIGCTPFASRQTK